MPNDETHYQLSWDDALRCHDIALSTGGAHGILNSNSIHSALARPFNGYYEEIHEKVASLVQSVVLNHGFADGNKRTAFLLAEVLIQRSGFRLEENDTDISEFFISIAQGEATLEEIANWFKNRIVSEVD